MFRQLLLPATPPRECTDKWLRGGPTINVSCRSRRCMWMVSHGFGNSNRTDARSIGTESPPHRLPSSQSPSGLRGNSEGCQEGRSDTAHGGRAMVRRPFVVAPRTFNIATVPSAVAAAAAPGSRPKGASERPAGGGAAVEFRKGWMKYFRLGFVPT